MYTPGLWRMGDHLGRDDPKRLAAAMFRSCGQMMDPYGSSGEQIQQTNFAQHGDISNVFRLLGGYSESWTVFWITAHFLNTASEFERMGASLERVEESMTKEGAPPRQGVSPLSNRHTALQAAELEVEDGQLICQRDKPFRIRLTRPMAGMVEQTAAGARAVSRSWDSACINPMAQSAGDCAVKPLAHDTEYGAGCRSVISRLASASTCLAGHWLSRFPPWPSRDEWQRDHRGTSN